MAIQNTKTYINKITAFSITILTVAILSIGIFAITNYNSRAAQNVAPAPTSAPTTPTPAPAVPVNVVTNIPTLAAIQNTDVQVTGTAAPSSTVTLKDASGNGILCKNAPITSDASGNYNCQLNTQLATGTVVSATAIEAGKSVSTPTTSTVTAAPVAPAPVTPAPVAPVPVTFNPLTINGGVAQFNIPDSLKNASTPSQYNANFSVPSLGDWKLTPGVAIPAIAGMVPVLAQKDPSNYLQTLISNQNPEIANKPTTRIVLDQAALDAASGVANFKPVEIGGASNLVRIPNLSTPATDDWWYIPKADIEAGGYKVQAGDVSNVGTPEATMAFYKGNTTNLATPVVDETLPHSFILQGTPTSFGPSYNFSLTGKASTPENLGSMDNIVRTSTFDNSGYKFALPKFNLPKVNLPGTGQVTANSNMDWSWLWWLLIPLLLFLLWLLSKLFGWFGDRDDSKKYSTTDLNTSYKTTTVKKTYMDEVAPKIETPKYIAPEVVEPVVKAKYVEPKAEVKSPKYLSDALDEVEIDAKPKFAAAATVAATATVAKYSNNYKSIKKNVSSAPIHKDNFQVIEGIGPVIENNLHDAGIMTYEDLANCSEAEIEKILAPISNNFTVFNCSTWAEQARLAADGKFDELEALKLILVKGVRVDGSNSDTTSRSFASTEKDSTDPFANHNNKSSASSSTTHKPTSSGSTKKDDLKIIEGIGPVIESNLHDAGVRTYEDLANTSEAEIEKILAPITNNFAVFNCSTWAEQARLAADGKFDELENLKDILIKGVRP
jgi:predicted flap endonuclease-1-like 5' DNA nuclease